MTAMSAKKATLTAAIIAFAVFLAVTAYFSNARSEEDFPNLAPASANASPPEFAALEAGPERKAAFFAYFFPLIEQQNQAILEARQKILKWQQRAESMGKRQRSELAELASRYGMEEFDVDRAEDWETLLRRVDTVPPSLALAQAAYESAWGTSRFSLEGSNYFGQWCFVAGCGLVPAAREAGKAHEVASFGSPPESVAAYIHNLNHHKAYKPLRHIRERLRAEDQQVTGLELAEGLSQYSERGDEYIAEIRSMIKDNGLQHCDVTPDDESCSIEIKE